MGLDERDIRNELLYLRVMEVCAGTAAGDIGVEHLVEEQVMPCIRCSVDRLYCAGAACDLVGPGEPALKALQLDLHHQRHGAQRIKAEIEPGGRVPVLSPAR